MKYVSVFGCNDIKEIKNKLLYEQVIKDILKNKIGINLDEYINYFSIENIPLKLIDTKKRTILCFDDIERRSDKVKLKDLLGLIERSSKQFDVIIVSNIAKFENEDKVLYSEYKEKIIDYEFRIGKVNDDIFRKILRNYRNKQDVEYEDRIIEIYKDNTYSFGKPLPGRHDYKSSIINNIRIYEKFINLLCRLEN